MRLALALIFGAWLGFAFPAFALDAAPRADGWSELSAITPDTAARLQQVLAVPLTQRGGYGGRVQAGAGLVFVQTPFPHEILALDPARPENPVRWRVTPKADATVLGQACCATTGGPVLEGDRLYVNTFDGHTMALEAATGRVLWDVRTDDGATLPDAPLVADGRVFVGSGGEDFGVRGWVEALDAATGRTLWRRYNTGPDAEVGLGAGGPPDQGVSTWPPDAWRQGGGGAHGLVLDPASGLLFHSTGRPAPWNPDQRQGENRWTSGLFAREAATGAVRWFLPVNPHDLYALGAGPSNLLADANGRQVLLHEDGNGRAYVVERASGKLLSAELFAPTNASKGVDLATGDLKRDDSKALTPNTVTRDICPGWSGATGPGTASFSPATKLLYIPVNQLCMDMEPRNVSYMSGTPYMGANLRMKAQPGHSRGALIAWDPATAKPAWTVPEDFPVLSGVLATAGGVVFYGTLDGTLKAVDARSGRPVWQARLAAGVASAPSTFGGADGRQYVAVVAGLWAPWQDIDVRDATAARGYANALRDLPVPTEPGGMLYLFALRP